MNKALFHGKEVNAYEIAQKWAIDKKAKEKYNYNGDFKCISPECKSSHLLFCNGKKRTYFRHFENINCTYSRYDEKIPSNVRKLKNLLSETFIKKNFNVQEDALIDGTSRVHFLFEQNKLAIEIGTNKTTGKYRQTKSDLVQSKGLKLFWMFLDDEPFEKSEAFTYLSNYCRYEQDYTVYFSPQNDTFVVELIYFDNHKYKLESTKYKFYYLEKSPLDNLTIENDCLSIPGFLKNANDWQNEKLTNYKRACEMLNEREKQQRKIQSDPNQIAESTDNKQKYFFPYNEELEKRHLKKAKKKYDKAQETARNIADEKFKQLDEIARNKIEEQKKEAKKNGI